MDRQHQIKRLAGILLIAVLPLLNTAYGADKNTRQTSPDGDEGYFGGGSPGNTNAMILWPRDDHNIVRKYRPAGSAAVSPLAFKLWVNPGRSGGFPVNLKHAGAFCSFLQNIGKDPDKGACICEDDPGRTYTGAPLGACAGVNFPACNPLACAPGTPEQTEETEDTRPDTRPACRWNTGTWTPSPVTRCESTSFTQRRRVTKIADNCVGGAEPASSRSATGTKYCPPPNPPGPEPVTRPTCQWTKGNWRPDRSRVCAGEPLTQTRNVRKITAYCEGGARPASSRPATGTKYCRPPNPPDPEPVTRPTCQWTKGNWRPDRSRICAGESLTQTRSVRKITAYCEGGARPASSRSTTGTKYCPPPCRWRVGSWSPSPASTCSDQRVSQRRSVTKITANCVGGTKPASTRTVPGRKHCPTCAPTSWSPTRDTVCAGESLTQSRTLGNCSTDSRTVSGARSCSPTCPVSGWSPNPSTVCAGTRLTQNRTGSDCKTQTRTATGTKSCRPKRKCGLPMRQLGNQCCAQWVNGNSIGCFSLD